MRVGVEFRAAVVLVRGHRDIVDRLDRYAIGPGANAPENANVSASACSVTDAGVDRINHCVDDPCFSTFGARVGLSIDLARLDTQVRAGVGVTRRTTHRGVTRGGGYSGGVGVHCRVRAFCGANAGRLRSRRGGLRSHDSSCSRHSELPFGGCLRKHYPNVGDPVNRA